MPTPSHIQVAPDSTGKKVRTYVVDTDKHIEPAIITDADGVLIDVGGLLAAIRDNVDTVETKLQSIIDNTDGLEGFTDGLEGLLTTIRDNADTLEAGFVTLNAKDFATEATVGRRFGTDKTTRAIQISSSGDNTIIDPAPGKFIRLHWLGLSTSENNAGEVLAIVKFGSDEIYRWNLGVPGAFSHWQIVEGVVDQNLVINLSAARAVEVCYTVEEV